MEEIKIQDLNMSCSGSYTSDNTENDNSTFQGLVYLKNNPIGLGVWASKENELLCAIIINNEKNKQIIYSEYSGKFFNNELLRKTIIEPLELDFNTYLQQGWFSNS